MTHKQTRKSTAFHELLEKHRTVSTQAVVTVGDGRGFVVKHHHERVIITAAHCLPSLPPPSTASYLEERTYKALLGPLGSDPTVWAECLFVDPVADIAVLGSPDNQDLFAQAEDYEKLATNATPLAITDAPKQGHERSGRGSAPSRTACGVPSQR